MDTASSADYIQHPPWIVIEGGGSRTRLAVTGPVSMSVDGPSSNPRSVGDQQAAATLHDLIATALSASEISASAVEFVVAAHGAASTVKAAGEFADLLGTVLRGSGVSAPIAVANDILPMLFDADADLVVAAIVGTGTDFLARKGVDRFAAASGLDYLLTDEGGGFDLGLHGLRAVCKALDGRGPRTLLTDRAREWCGTHEHPSLRDALFEKVYAAPARPLVASFARAVVSAAEAEDPVAVQLVTDAAEEVMEGIHAVRQAVGASAEPMHLIMSGSLATTGNPYQALLMTRIADSFPTSTIATHGDDLLSPATDRFGRFLLDRLTTSDRLRIAGNVVFRSAG